jgi:WD40 repeat protein
MLASASNDGSVIVWNMQGSIPMQKLKVLQSTEASSSSSIPPVVGLAYHPGRNVLISCGGRDDRRLTFWDLS